MKRRARGTDSRGVTSIVLDAERAPRDAAEVGLIQSGFRTVLRREMLRLALPPPAGGDREPAPAVWSVMCRLERMLREHRDAIAARGLRSHVELMDVG